jgi:hypothetical protein
MIGKKLLPEKKIPLTDLDKKKAKNLVEFGLTQNSPSSNAMKRELEFMLSESGFKTEMESALDFWDPFETIAYYMH